MTWSRNNHTFESSESFTPKLWFIIYSLNHRPITFAISRAGSLHIPLHVHNHRGCIIHLHLSPMGDKSEAKIPSTSENLVSTNYANKQAICNCTGEVSPVLQESLLLLRPSGKESEIASCWFLFFYFLISQRWKGKEKKLIERSARVVESCTLTLVFFKRVVLTIGRFLGVSLFAIQLMIVKSAKKKKKQKRRII